MLVITLFKSIHESTFEVYCHYFINIEALATNGVERLGGYIMG